MIKVNSLNKYYFRGKTNENHVINNFSYTFEDTGLYCLFGKSGSGKTTLLNCIGLVDSFDNGSIIYEGEFVNSYISKKCDEIRNEMIGYIYQNYNLIEDMTVAQNIEVILNLINCNDKDERKKRIKRVLEAVGLYKHRNKNVNALSGGERQRVAIARALAKKPSVILADEPTGNLDSNNTFEIMNIIKKISKECLVILVSHEKPLVDFYADFIIEIQDGKMLYNKMNVNKGSLVHSDPRNIYLTDFSKNEVNEENVHLNIYKDENTKSDLSINIVFRNNELFISGSSECKINFIDDNSEVRIIDKNEETYIKELGEKETDVSFDDFISSNAQKRKRLTSLFASFKNSFKGGLFIKRKKVTKIGLVILAAIFSIISLSVGSIFNYDEKDYILTPDNVVGIELNRIDEINKVTYSDVLALEEKNKDCIFISYDRGDICYMSTLMTSFYQSSEYYNCSQYVFFEPLNFCDSSYILGTAPTNENEIAISKWVADSILECQYARPNGYFEYSNIIGLINDVTISNSYDGISLKITGIVDEESPTVYVSENIFGKVTSKVDSGSENIYVITKDKSSIVEQLYKFNKVYDVQETAKSRYLLEMFDDKKGDAIVLALVVLISVVYLSLLVRSSMFERIKEIGVLRTIGATKGDIRSLFVGEMIGITTQTSFVSYSLIYIIISLYSSSYSLEALGINLFVSSFASYIIGLLFIYLVNVIACLIPVNSLLHKTPIEIIKKYDI